MPGATRTLPVLVVDDPRLEYSKQAISCRTGEHVLFLYLGRENLPTESSGRESEQEMRLLSSRHLTCPDPILRTGNQRGQRRRLPNG